MNFELGQVLLIGVTYLSILFGIAYVADRGLIPDRYIRHPITYILSIGVVAGAWAIFGMVDSPKR